MIKLAIQIEVDSLHWVSPDNPAIDLCAHGGIRVYRGDVVYVDEPDAGHAVSTGALHLLRALERDHPPQDPPWDHLVPCCGHFMFYDPARAEVVNIGCPNGVNWWVRHLPDDRVALQFSGQREVVLDTREWREAILAFSAGVRAFYFGAGPKQPADPEEAEWYSHFVAEWEHRHHLALVAD